MSSEGDNLYTVVNKSFMADLKPRHVLIPNTIKGHEI